MLRSLLAMFPFFVIYLCSGSVPSWLTNREFKAEINALTERPLILLDIESHLLYTPESLYEKLRHSWASERFIASALALGEVILIRDYRYRTISQQLAVLPQVTCLCETFRDQLSSKRLIILITDRHREAINLQSYLFEYPQAIVRLVFVFRGPSGRTTQLLRSLSINLEGVAYGFSPKKNAIVYVSLDRTFFHREQPTHQVRPGNTLLRPDYLPNTESAKFDDDILLPVRARIQAWAKKAGRE